jgi:hypothetical protein
MAMPVLALALSAQPPAEAPPPDETCFHTVEEFNWWMDRYYLAPEPEKIVCSLRSGSSLYEDNPSAHSPLAHFYAAVLRGNRSLTTKVFDHASANEGERFLALHALWVVHTAETAKLVSRAKEAWRSSAVDAFIERLESKRPLDPLERPLTEPESLDDLWATFAATGDERIVARIASVAHLQEDGHGMEIIVGGTARWSLQSMVDQHARVRAAVEKLAASAEGVTKVILEEMLVPPRSGDQ